MSDGLPWQGAVALAFPLLGCAVTAWMCWFSRRRELVVSFELDEDIELLPV